MKQNFKQKTLFIGLLVLISVSFAVGQIENDSIIIVKKVNDIAARYFYNDQQLSFDSLYQLMKVNDEAFHHIKQAKGSRNFAKIVAFTRGFIMGYAIGKGMQDHSINGGAVAVGGFISLLSIIGIVETNKHQRKAVDIYNSNLSAQLPKTNKIKFGFGQTTSGVGFSLRF